jgi:hypothetical protein
LLPAQSSFRAALYSALTTTREPSSSREPINMTVQAFNSMELPARRFDAAADTTQLFLRSPPAST